MVTDDQFRRVHGVTHPSSSRATVDRLSRANLGIGRALGKLSIPLGRSSGLNSVSAGCNSLEASHIDCNALRILDVEAVLLAAEPRDGGD